MKDSKGYVSNPPVLVLKLCHHFLEDVAWLLRTLIGNRDSMNRQAADENSNFQFEGQSSEQLRSYIARVALEGLRARDWPTAVRSFTIRANGTLKGRRFFPTRSNRMGLVPNEARDGNWIALILGNQVPYVLRSLKRGDYSCRLIGECYIDGFMYGELVPRIRDGTLENQKSTLE